MDAGYGEHRNRVDVRLLSKQSGNLCNGRPCGHYIIDEKYTALVKQLGIPQ